MERSTTPPATLERRVNKLEWYLRLSAAGWLAAVALFILSAWMWSAEAQRVSRPESMRVSELVVVDTNGVERVRIGGDLPDAIIGGKKVPRGEKASGVLLYDATGSERSGYVTFEPSGNVGLTLDTRKSQVAMFVAGPDSGSALQLWDGRDSIEFRSDGDGSRLTAVKGGQVVVQQPELGQMTAGMCSAFKEALARVSREQVGRDCRRRFTEGPCNACLGK